MSVRAAQKKWWSLSLLSYIALVVQSLCWVSPLFSFFYFAFLSEMLPAGAKNLHTGTPKQQGTEPEPLQRHLPRRFERSMRLWNSWPIARGPGEEEPDLKNAKDMQMRVSLSFIFGFFFPKLLRKCLRFSDRTESSGSLTLTKGALRDLTRCL